MSSKVCRTETESPVKRCARTGPTKSQKITEKPNTISFFYLLDSLKVEQQIVKHGDIL